jgi:hypothetical protein
MSVIVAKYDNSHGKLLGRASSWPPKRRLGAKKADVPVAAFDVAFGRVARLQWSPTERPESELKPPFRREPEKAFSASAKFRPSSSR